jgi:hypothetical protein
MYAWLYKINLALDIFYLVLLLKIIVQISFNFIVKAILRVRITHLMAMVKDIEYSIIYPFVTINYKLYINNI